MILLTHGGFFIVGPGFSHRSAQFENCAMVSQSSCAYHGVVGRKWVMNAGDPTPKSQRITKWGQM